MGARLTRRTFLARGATAAGALLAARGGATALLDRAAKRTTRPSLTPSRRRTFEALVDAVGHGSRSQVDPRGVPAAARQLASDYSAALEPTRDAIDDVLDRLGRAGFAAQRDQAARIAILKQLPPEETERAIALAAAPFHPPASDFHPTPVVLL